MPDPATTGNPYWIEQFANPYLAMGNNPAKTFTETVRLIYVDPDGEFVFEYLLLATELGYDIQKSISPVAFQLHVPIGTHQDAIGFNISIGMPQIGTVSYRHETGVSYYYGDRIGGYGKGFQIRQGGEWSLASGTWRYGGMRYRDYGSDGNLLVDQVVHTAKVGTAFNNIAYSNDTDDSFPWASSVPLIPNLRNGSIAENDRYRTASGRLRFGLFEVGFFLHTGEAETTVRTYDNGNLTSEYFSGGNIDDPTRSNGIAYFGFGGFNVGWDSEGVRNFLQNRVAHDGWSAQPQYGTRYPWFEELDRNPRFVFQFGNF